MKFDERRNENVKKRRELQTDEAAISNNKVVNINDTRKAAKNKKKLNSGALTLIALVLVAVIFLLGPMIIKTATGNISETEILKNGTIEKLIKTESIVIREEQVYSLDNIGTSIPNYKEGDQIAAGKILTSVIDNDLKEMANDIKKINEKIKTVKEFPEDNEDFVNQEIKNIDQEIKKKLHDFSNMYNTNDMTLYTEIYNEIEILLEQKTGLKDAGGSSSYIKDLEARKKSLENTLKGRMKEIVSDAPGTVSYVIDGFEGKYTPVMVRNENGVSPESFDIMLENIKKGKPDKAGAPYEYVKMITDFNYYFICNVKTTTDINNMEKGTEIEVRVNDKNLIVTAIIENINKGKDNSILVLKASGKLSQMTNIRIANIDIILKKVNGIKVPIRAVTDINHVDQTGIIALVKPGYLKNIKVKILLSNDDYAIIDNMESEEEKFTYNDMISLEW